MFSFNQNNNKSLLQDILNSGQVLIVTCLTPIKQLRKRVNIKKEKLETKFWVDDFIKYSW